MFILKRERERDRVRAGEGQREKETQNPESEAGSRHCAVNTDPNMGLELTRL